MSFYLEPPNGNIALQNLEKFAEKRLDFLIKIFSAKNDSVKLFDIVQDAVNVADSDCLIEGTKKDAISHFILRLAFCSENDTQEFFLAAETSLFEFRFLCMNEDELTDLFRKTEKSITNNIGRTVKIFFPYLKIFEILKNKFNNWRKVVKLYLVGDNSHFCVPFCYVFNLVAKRQVILFNGIAAVPLSKLREVVTDIFKQLLKEGMKMAVEKRQVAMMDIRMGKLLRKLVMLLRQKHKPFSDHCDIVTNLLHDTVSMETKFFPPCMYNLFKVLEERHRLRHHSRIQLTLFLKEIGMPVHEALMFWRKEYSTPVDNQDGCQHGWKDNEKRYFYNIRHLYGLEGSHINYRAHCCSSLQNFTPFTGEVGGCPFKHFDSGNLNRILKDMRVTDRIRQTVGLLVKSGDFGGACAIVCSSKFKRNGHLMSSSQDIGFSTPPDFHAVIKEGKQIRSPEDIECHINDLNFNNKLDRSLPSCRCTGSPGNCSKLSCQNTCEVVENICFKQNSAGCCKDTDVSIEKNDVMVTVCSCFSARKVNRDSTEISKPIFMHTINNKCQISQLSYNSHKMSTSRTSSECETLSSSDNNSDKMEYTNFVSVATRIDRKNCYKADVLSNDELQLNGKLAMNSETCIRTDMTEVNQFLLLRKPSDFYFMLKKVLLDY